MIDVLYNPQTPLQGAQSVFTREDHRIKEFGLVRDNRVPRRSQTHQYHELSGLSVSAIQCILEELRVTEESPRKQRVTSTRPRPESPRDPAPRRRPPLGPPRRSYSATDKEPLPPVSVGLSLLDLPAELHFAVFDFLDPIDSTCLGLTNKHFYAIHRRMRGTVPLSTRRDGPNELEWAWHLAGAVTRAAPVTPSCELSSEVTTGLESNKNTLSRLRVRGQGYCRKCGITRCELHKHIQSWIGEGAEYCSIKRKFGEAAPEGAKAYCYMSKPGDPNRCGRHRVRRSKVVLQ